MANTVLSHIEQPKVQAVSGIGTFVAVFFLAWLTLVFILGARGVFVAPSGAPPLALLIGLVAPVSLFLLGYRTIRPLREFILSADLRIIVGIQAWRWAGIGFLSLYSYGVLPGVFAWPAGLGDMAIGVTAPSVLASLLRRPDFAASKSFVAWNLSGILDLTVAVSIGALVPLLAPNFYGAVSTAPMTQTAACADSDILGADILDTAFDRAVSGATSRRISNALPTQKSQTCAEIRLGGALACAIRL